MSETSTNNIDELRWVRAFSPDVIPIYLVEQIKDRDFEVEDFYKFQSLNCQIQSDKGLMLNPFNHLYALANKENKVVGFLWAVIEPLGKDLIVNTYSVDKDYWNGSQCMKKAIDHVKELLKKLQLRKVFWITNYPKHSERYGFKRSRCVMMEYEEKKDGQDISRGNEENGRCRSSKPSTKGIDKSSSGTSRS